MKIELMFVEMYGSYFVIVLSPSLSAANIPFNSSNIICNNSIGITKRTLSLGKKITVYNA